MAPHPWDPASPRARQFAGLLPTSEAECRRALEPDYQPPALPNNDLAGLWSFQVVVSRDNGTSVMRLRLDQKNCTGRRFTTIFKALPSTRSAILVRAFRSESSWEGAYQASDWAAVKVHSPA